MSRDTILHFMKRGGRWLAMLLAVPVLVFILWQGGRYTLWQIYGLLLNSDLIPAEHFNRYANPDPEFARVERLHLKISHLNTRLMQITSGIPLLDFFAGPHEKEQLLTEMVALYSQIIDQSSWKNSTKDAPLLTTDYIGRGMTYSALGQPQKALADYNQALRLSPQDSITLLNRGYEYASLGLSEQAVRDLDQFLQDTASVPELWSFQREHAQQKVNELKQSRSRHS